MAAVGRLIVAGARLVARLMPRRRRSAAEQARLARAVAGIDRELAGNLELVTMFMQTKQPAVLENAAMRAYRGEIAAADETTAGRLDALYDAMSEAESAMERRGPGSESSGLFRAGVHAPSAIGWWTGFAREWSGHPPLSRLLAFLASVLPFLEAASWVRSRGAPR